VLPGKDRTPEDLLRILWRWRWAAIGPFVVVFAATLVGGRIAPDRYRSETLIQVVPQQVPSDYVRPTLTTRVQDRLRSLQNQIPSRTRLEQVIRDFDLYAAERARMPLEDVVELMRRRDVTVETVRGDAFRVAYTSGSPRTAQRVAERLASEFTKESLQDREVLATATSNFLTEQLDDARRRLAEQEAKLADFQRRHAGQLPSERDSNVAVMNNLQLQAQTVGESANRDRDRRLMLERTLADLLAERLPSAAAPPAAAEAAGQTARGTAADQLEAARETLRALETTLKPEHPDVVYMKRVIADLEARATAEGVSHPARPARPRTPEDAAQARRVEQTRQEIASLDIQIASKGADEIRLRDQIDRLQKRVSATPGLEAELTALTRDYDTVRRSYESLLSKQEDSKVSAALERNQIGEAFRVIDSARLPESPSSPNRRLINLAGAAAGLFAGFALVLLFDYRDKGLRSEDDVVAVLKVPVLAGIPEITTPRSRRRAVLRRVLEIMLAAAAVVLLAAAALFAWSPGVRVALSWFK
jgi:polysaccharide chain length determinant protein (PEP-CTERM system associated)